MRKWLVLGLVLVGVVWGPFVYAELTRSPEKSHGRGRQAFGFFGDDEDETAAEADPAREEPAAKPPGPEAAEPEAETLAATKTGTVLEEEQAEPPVAVEAADPTEVDPKPDDEAADEEPRPTWPTTLTPAFRKAFEAEPRDGFWAQSAEPRLRALLRVAGVTDAALGEVACRKTVCRLAFSAEDLESDVENKLFDALDKEFGPNLALDDKHSAAHAALYLLRSGYQLEP
jgi:hypothetical protein